MFDADLEGNVYRLAVDSRYRKFERARLGLDAAYTRLVYLLNEATNSSLW